MHGWFAEKLDPLFMLESGKSAYFEITFCTIILFSVFEFWKFSKIVLTFCCWQNSTVQIVRSDAHRRGFAQIILCLYLVSFHFQIRKFYCYCWTKISSSASQRKKRLPASKGPESLKWASFSSDVLQLVKGRFFRTFWKSSCQNTEWFLRLKPVQMPLGKSRGARK